MRLHDVLERAAEMSRACRWELFKGRAVRRVRRSAHYAGCDGNNGGVGISPCGKEMSHG